MEYEHKLIAVNDFYRLTAFVGLKSLKWSLHIKLQKLFTHLPPPPPASFSVELFLPYKIVEEFPLWYMP